MTTRFRASIEPASEPKRQKVALIMSCDYFGRNRLYGCVNDGNDIKNFLVQKRGFDPSNITTVFNKDMTVKGIWDALEGMVNQSKAISKMGMIPTMVLYYSGHGILVPDEDSSTKGDELYDSAIVPWDHERNGFIIDDQLYSRFITQLDPKTELFIFPDCCYSGSNFDLKYRSLITRRAEEESLQTKIIQLSGCRDDQTSAEVAGHGVATSAFLKLMDRVSAPYSIQQFKKDMGDVSTPNHPQHPQVSFSREDMREENVFDWLVTDVGGVQVLGKTLRKLAKQERNKDFFKRLGLGIHYILGHGGLVEPTPFTRNSLEGTRLVKGEVPVKRETVPSPSSKRVAFSTRQGTSLLR